MSDSEKPVRAIREENRLSVARVLLKARADAGIDQHEIAAACGVNKSVPHEWEKRDGSKSPWLADVALMPRPIATAALRWLAGQLGFTVREETEEEEVGIHLLHEVLAETSHATVALSAALSDGALSPCELEQIEREANEAADTLAKLATAARKHRERNLRSINGGKT